MNVDWASEAAFPRYRGIRPYFSEAREKLFVHQMSNFQSAKPSQAQILNYKSDNGY